MSIYLIKKNNLNSKYLRFLSKQLCVLHSTQIQTKPIQDENENQEIKDFESFSKLHKREYVKKPQKKPFVKGLFVGEFDTDVLTYPEIGKKEDLARLENFVKIPENSKNLTGWRAPQMYGGKEFNITEVCHIGETVMENFGRLDLVYSENLGLQTLLKFGSEKLISRYVNLITSNGLTTALHIPEFENNAATLKATKIENDQWVLNGEVPLIVNGNKANLFIVLAENEFFSEKGLKEIAYTGFIIERDFGGISSESINVHMCDVDVSTVKFCNVTVSKDNIIGEENKGKDIIPKLLTEYRLSFGPICSSLLKNCISRFTQFCKTSKHSKNVITAEIVLDKIGKMASTLYAMESMTYLTAGLLDEYENQDCEMEAAIVKAYSTDQCQRSILKCFNFISNKSYLTEKWCRDLHETSLNVSNVHESLDSLKLIIALQGLSYAGIQMQELVTQLRNPLFYAAKVFKQLWINRKQDVDKPKLTLGLLNYLHPSLQGCANELEYCVMRLKYLVEVLLLRHGPEIITKHVDLINLAECAIDIYAATASLGRASRSYCIGLRHCDQEVVLAAIIANDVKDRVKYKINRIIDGPYTSRDGIILTNGKYLLDQGKYFPEHPTMRNF